MRNFAASAQDDAQICGYFAGSLQLRTGHTITWPDKALRAAIGRPRDADFRPKPKNVASRAPKTARDKHVTGFSG